MIDQEKIQRRSVCFHTSAGLVHRDWTRCSDGADAAGPASSTLTIANKRALRCWCKHMTTLQSNGFAPKSELVTVVPHEVSR